METREAQLIAAAIDQRYPQATDLGIYSCRPIRGEYAQSDDWSQHAWGNALDRGHPDPSVLQDMHNWAQQARRRGTLPIGRHDGAILLYPGQSIHIEGPEQTGLPPCAGGPTPPDVLNPPRDDGTAEVPGPGSPSDTETIGGGIRADSPLDRVTGALDAVQGALSTVTDAGTWLRVLQAVGGLVLVVVGVVIVGSEVAGQVASA